MAEKSEGKVPETDGERGSATGHLQGPASWLFTLGLNPTNSRRGPGVGRRMEGLLLNFLPELLLVWDGTGKGPRPAVRGDAGGAAPCWGKDGTGSPERVRGKTL